MRVQRTYLVLACLALAAISAGCSSRSGISDGNSSPVGDSVETTPQPGTTADVVPTSPASAAPTVPTFVDPSSPNYNLCQTSLDSCTVSIAKCQLNRADLTTVTLSGIVTNQDSVEENYLIELGMDGGGPSQGVAHVTVNYVKPGASASWNTSGEMSNTTTENPTCSVQLVEVQKTN